MINNKHIKTLGESELIKLIEERVVSKIGKILIRDDSFFFEIFKDNNQTSIALNTDMFVSTTDAPNQMNFYQMGRKAIIMNISDLIVKGIVPQGIIISLGLPDDMKISHFIELLDGMIDNCKKWNMDYLGGDINKTNEIVINPTVFGFQNPADVIYRRGIQLGDLLIANEKFGLTGVGFDILLNKNGNFATFPSYKRALKSVLEPDDIGIEAYILAKNHIATSSIDSSDGLAKSLRDLMLSNPNVGFEIDFNEELIDKEALAYSKEYNIPIEELIFEGGEEFIHLFTIQPKNFNLAKSVIKEGKGKIYKIGKVISEEKIYFLKNNTKIELTSTGFEHFK